MNRLENESWFLQLPWEVEFSPFSVAMLLSSLVTQFFCTPFFRSIFYVQGILLFLLLGQILGS